MISSQRPARPLVSDSIPKPPFTSTLSNPVCSISSKLIRSFWTPSSSPSSANLPSTLLVKPTWSKLFYNPLTTPESRKLDFIQPSRDGDLVVAACKQSEIESISSFWEGAVEGLLVGRRPHIPSLKKFLISKWNIKAPLEITLQMDGSIWFRFSNEEEKKRVLDSGPHFIAGHVLILRPWRRRLALDKSLLSTIPIWIKLPGLPIEFWSVDSLSRIGSLIGTPLFIDDCTASHSRTKFARLCIEVSADNSLPGSVMINTDGKDQFEQTVQYEWRPAICTKCQVFFHNVGECAVVTENKGRPLLGNFNTDKGRLSSTYPAGVKGSSLRMEGVISEVSTDISVAPTNPDTLGWTLVDRNRRKFNPVATGVPLPAGQNFCPVEVIPTVDFFDCNLPAGQKSFSGESITTEVIVESIQASAKVDREVVFSDGEDSNVVGTNLIDGGGTDSTPQAECIEVVEMQKNLNKSGSQGDLNIFGVSHQEAVSNRFERETDNFSISVGKGVACLPGIADSTVAGQGSLETLADVPSDLNSFVSSRIARVPDYFEKVDGNPLNFDSATVENGTSKELSIVFGFGGEAKRETGIVGENTFKSDLKANNGESDEGNIKVDKRSLSDRDELSLDGLDQGREVQELEEAPPGFDARLEEKSDDNSIETAVHIAEETSESDEEVSGFSSSRARMIREKLGIRLLGTGNADKAFADFCKNRQMEIETNRKKSVVPDVSIKLRNQMGKRGLSYKLESGRKKKS